MVAGVVAEAGEYATADSARPAKAIVCPSEAEWDRGAAVARRKRLFLRNPWGDAPP